MQTALNIIYAIFSQTINFLFNTAELFPGVTIGWIIVFLAIFGIIINAIFGFKKEVK